MRTRGSVTALVTVLIASCAGQPGGTSGVIVDVPSRVVTTGQQIAVGGWTSDTEMLLNASPELAADEQLQVVDLDTGDLSRFTTAVVRDCNRRDLSAVDRTSDGRIVVIDTCHYQDEAGMFRVGREINVVDVQTGVVTLVDELADQPGIGPVAVRDDLEQTVVPIGSRICQTLALIEDGVLVPLDLVVRDGERRFNLSDDSLDATPGCQDHGIADSPDWSSDGRTLAFVASVDAIGMDGPDRLDAARGLYLWRGDDEVSPVLKGLHHVRDVRWSPDGTWLAFGADVDGRGRGTWLFEPVSGRLIRVSEHQALTLGWSPDGQSLAITYPPGSPASPIIDLVVLDVRTVVID